LFDALIGDAMVQHGRAGCEAGRRLQLREAPANTMLYSGATFCHAGGRRSSRPDRNKTNDDNR
jgi:hypothetical protein